MVLVRSNIWACLANMRKILSQSYLGVWDWRQNRKKVFWMGNDLIMMFCCSLRFCLLLMSTVFLSVIKQKIYVYCLLQILSTSNHNIKQECYYPPPNNTTHKKNVFHNLNRVVLSNASISMDLFPARYLFICREQRKMLKIWRFCCYLLLLLVVVVEGAINNESSRAIEKKNRCNKFSTPANACVKKEVENFIW